MQTDSVQNKIPPPTPWNCHSITCPTSQFTQVFPQPILSSQSELLFLRRQLVFPGTNQHAYYRAANSADMKRMALCWAVTSRKMIERVHTAHRPASWPGNVTGGWRACHKLPLVPRRQSQSKHLQLKRTGSQLIFSFLVLFSRSQFKIDFECWVKIKGISPEQKLFHFLHCILSVDGWRLGFCYPWRWNIHLGKSGALLKKITCYA